MKLLNTTYIFSFLFSISLYTQAQNLEAFFDATDNFMQKWVKNGDIDYAKLKAASEELSRLKKMIAKANIIGLSNKEQKAFYINAYNLLVIDQITESYPLKSALDKSGFFDAIKHKVAGSSATLDRIEKGYLILRFGDPKVHFALACASKSCPKLASFAYRPEILDEQLSKRTKLALNNEGIVNIDSSEKKVWISKIFLWYMRDFEGHEAGVLKFINNFRRNKLPQWPIEYMEYDWTLNEQEVGR